MAEKKVKKQGSKKGKKLSSKKELSKAKTLMPMATLRGGFPGRG
jgi:hypothetical protein